MQCIAEVSLPRRSRRWSLQSPGRPEGSVDRPRDHRHSADHLVARLSRQRFARSGEQPGPDLPDRGDQGGHEKDQGLRPDGGGATDTVAGLRLLSAILDAAATVKGPVTSSSMLKALNHLHDANTDGIIPPISMIPRAPANDHRDFDTNIQTYKIESGHLTDPAVGSTWAPARPCRRVTKRHSIVHF